MKRILDVINIIGSKLKIRSFLLRSGFLPMSMRRSNPDRRVQGDRRIHTIHNYLAVKGADRRFEPDRRSHIERRVSGFDFESPNGF